MVVADRQKKPIIPSESERELATQSSRILAKQMNSHSKTQKIKVESERGKEEQILIPSVAYELLLEILSQMSQGNAVTLVPVHAELTTQKAANLLNVSRPHLIKLLESGEIPFRKVGTHRKILAEDLFKYKSDIDAKRSQSLDELTAMTEELGLYDDEY